MEENLFSEASKHLTIARRTNPEQNIFLLQKAWSVVLQHACEVTRSLEVTVPVGTKTG
jgi:hypothetical protein